MKLLSKKQANHANLVIWCLVRPDSVKLPGKRFVWSVRSSLTPLNIQFQLKLQFSHFLLYFQFIAVFTIFLSTCPACRGFLARSHIVPAVRKDAWLLSKYNFKHQQIGGWGVTPTGKSFRFVRACARSDYQVEFELKCVGGFSLFPFVPPSFPVSLAWHGVFPFSHAKSK